MIQLFNSVLDVLAQLVQLVTLVQEPKRFANHLVRRGVMSGGDLFRYDFFQLSTVRETFTSRVLRFQKFFLLVGITETSNF